MILGNLIWPSIIILGVVYSWYIILIGLIIETIAAHIFIKTGWLRSLGIMFVVNAISALIGLIFIPISGIIVEVLTSPFGGGTFHISHWILDYLMVVVVNTLIEGISLQCIFKYPFRKNFWWLFGANTISVIIGVVTSLLQL